MTDIIQTLFNPLPNAVMTVLMIIIVMYWLFSLLSGIDSDFDFGIDVSPDIDADADIDGDIDGDSDGSSSESGDGWFMRFIKFINIGKVPFMLVLSTFKLFTWIGSLITTKFVSFESWGWKSIFILIPIGFIAVFLTKLATQPMVKFYKELGYKGEDPTDFLGRSGKMLSTIKDEKIGTAEFVIDSNPMRLNVKSLNGHELKYGEHVVVEDESADKKIFIVSKEINLDNI